MKRQRWIIAAVILALVGVIIAKQGLRAPQTEHPTEVAQPQPASETPEAPLPGSSLADCLKSGRPTMADFGKRACVPCKQMEPILKQAARDYRGKANIVFVDLEAYPQLAREYLIRIMPTQIFFDADGKEVDSHMGYMGLDEIERQLASLGVRK